MKSLRLSPALANAAISIVRLKGRFLHMPRASRHYASRQVPDPPNASEQEKKRPSPPSRTQSLGSFSVLKIKVRRSNLQNERL